MGSVPRVSDLDRALDVLLDAQLAPIVDMVARRVGTGVDDDAYEVASAEGAVTFRRTGPGPDGSSPVRPKGGEGGGADGAPSESSKDDRWLWVTGHPSGGAHDTVRRSSGP